MKRLCLSMFIISIFLSNLNAEFYITVYNNNLALVKETKAITLESGLTHYRFEPVPKMIDPTSVSLKTLTYRDNARILEQNYEYDLVNQSKLIEKYIGQNIDITTEDGKSVSGKLLTSSDNAIIQNDKGEVNIIYKDQIRDIRLAQLPEGLILKPSLLWYLDVDKEGVQDIEISYLTGGMNWEAKYVAITDNDDKNLTIDGWVVLTNNSGTVYNDAKLKLVAGDINRVQPDIMQKEMVRFASKAPTQDFQEESFFEYHLYTLNRKTTLKNNEQKEITLFPTANTEATKIYTYNPDRYKDVRVEMEFINSRQSGLGIPLPKGIVRVYKKDSENMLQFIGEDRIDHTPTNEKVRLFLGNTFDIVGEKNIVDKKRITDRSTEETVSIKLRNRKDEDISVTVVENLWGEWFITESNFRYIKESVNRLVFNIDVPKDKETELIYTIRKKW